MVADDLADELGRLAQLQAASVERELRTYEARYRSLVEASDAVVWIADPKGRFVAPNNAWSAYTGQSEADARGHGWLDALHRDDRTLVFDSLQDARRERTSWEGWARVYHAASGAYRRSVLRAVPLVGNDGEIVEWVGTVTDNDGDARSEEVLRAAERNARAAAEASSRLSEALSKITAAVVNALDDDVIARQTGESLARGIRRRRRADHTVRPARHDRRSAVRSRLQHGRHRRAPKRRRPRIVVHEHGGPGSRSCFL